MTRLLIRALTLVGICSAFQLFSESVDSFENKDDQFKAESSFMPEHFTEHSRDLNVKFNAAYENNVWANSESRSGDGSTLAYTESFRKDFAAMIANLGCKSIVDAPCGDYNWMKETDLNGVTYIGGDIADVMIGDLQAKYPSVDFRVMDITTCVLPCVDIWLCRDVLFHLSNADVQKVIDNFKRSNIKYFATSHFYYDHVNYDIESKPLVYRQVNLTKPPFNLPQPDYLIKDSIPGFPERWLGIWDRDNLL